MNKTLRQRFRPGALLALLLALLLCSLGPAAPAGAQLITDLDDQGKPLVRSLESLRDLDYQAWQLVAFREGPPGGALRLRVVGYPGKVRLNHPTALTVASGQRRWELEDVTLANPKLAGDAREAAAEFNLEPLLSDLTKDRPLRLQLPGVFTELPVPPFVVKEWRELPSS